MSKSNIRSLIRHNLWKLDSGLKLLSQGVQIHKTEQTFRTRGLQLMCIIFDLLL